MIFHQDLRKKKLIKRDLLILISRLTRDLETISSISTQIRSGRILFCITIHRILVSEKVASSKNQKAAFLDLDSMCLKTIRKKHMRKNFLSFHCLLELSREMTWVLIKVWYKTQHQMNTSLIKLYRTLRAKRMMVVNIPLDSIDIDLMETTMVYQELGNTRCRTLVLLVK